MLPPPPSSPRSPPEPPHRSILGRAWAIVGVILGIVFILPAIFAVRSFWRWRAGKIAKPTFAWIWAWIGTAILVPIIGLTVWVEHFAPPLVQDDFSDASSGWPVSSDPRAMMGYVDGAFEIALNEPMTRSSILNFVPDPSPYPRRSLTVQAEVTEVSSVSAKDFAGVGCWEFLGAYGYVFAVGIDGSWAIIEVSGGETTVLASGKEPETIRGRGKTNLVEGECYGFGTAPALLYINVNGTRVGSAEGSTGDTFYGFGLTVVAGEGGTVVVRFDDALARRAI